MSPRQKPTTEADAPVPERASPPAPAEEPPLEQTGAPSSAQEAADPAHVTEAPEDATRRGSEPEGISRPPGDDNASDDREQGEISESPLPDEAPPLPNEAPPLPNEAAPLPTEQQPPSGDDDGWDYRWDYPTNRYIFFNRITGQETLENPRVPAASSTAAAAPPPGAPATAAVPEPPVVTGYNPAIHGDYDPNAWYAKLHEPSATTSHAEAPGAMAVPFDPRDPGEEATTTALFNRFTGQYQTEGPGRHGDEAKGRRQMNAYFDVDAAANAHDGRSLKAERSGKKPSKNELRQFKEKRKARKEEKRRAWLRD